MVRSRELKTTNLGSSSPNTLVSGEPKSLPTCLQLPVLHSGEVITLPKGYLSVSQIETYLRCPKQYEQAYVHRNREEDRIEMVEGTIFHRVAERSNRLWIEKKKHLSVRDALAAWKTFSTEEFEKVKEWGSETPRTVKKRAETFIEDLFPDPGWEPTQAEHEFSTTLAGVKVVGVIDMLDEESVTDFKVASTADYYNPKMSLQSLLYRLHTGRKRFRYEIFEKRYGKRRILWDDVEDTERFRPYVEYVVLSVALSISRGAFPLTDPVKNPLCSKRFCHLWSSCVGSMRL